MISNNARDGFDYMFMQGLKGGLLASPEDNFEISVLPDLSEVKESKLVILTVSSYLFRLMVLIYFTPDQATREHFARVNKSSVEGMSERDFDDAISECGNISCGILNRELAHFFPNIGMSTPNILDKDCSSYLAILNTGHVQHLRVDINETVHFHASLCVCAYADLDFKVEISEEEANTGELELF
ncbi:MAG: hypothetical protein KJ614_18900 [Gammaproteobacteria bacterium]|uniref:hypothetical protein n=1 Tax=Rhodoferax sp. TaxID=50421 RepID=UPI00181FD747|nr:hypothetical protein [Rhodoferax sp.]MBU3900952.1 hypothetical protein [Gammaproteobacteria bacterium]MBA3056487.1 hypothetical protein [Rhodoferax sp.]MBU3996819.1 hypothetical protein [Gammaproteobacteria bacterium]MBU4017626.1 hypothetical protein [Gammaproteobacteria bacterium]MBU4081069.1 hypothetical protein [Gammaproteobacteria bacterium]